MFGTVIGVYIGWKGANDPSMTVGGTSDCIRNVHLCAGLGGDGTC